MNRIIKVRSDEEALERVVLNSRRADEVPLFRRGKFASRLFFSEERVLLNVLVRTLNSLNLVVKSVNRKNETSVLQVNLENERSIRAHIVNLRSPDQDVTERILDISGGLSERLADDPHLKRRLGKHNLSFVIPFIPAEVDDSQVMSELVAFITGENLDRLASESPKLTRVGNKYAILEALNAQAYCRTDEFGLIQVTRGAMATAPPFRIQDEIAANVRSAIQRTARLPEGENWLIVWFVSFYELFPIDEQFTRRCAGFDLGPFSRLLISNGSEILDCYGDPVPVHK